MTDRGMPISQAGLFRRCYGATTLPYRICVHMYLEIEYGRAADSRPHAHSGLSCCFNYAGAVVLKARPRSDINMALGIFKHTYSYITRIHTSHIDVVTEDSAAAEYFLLIPSAQLIIIHSIGIFERGRHRPSMTLSSLWSESPFHPEWLHRSQQIEDKKTSRSLTALCWFWNDCQKKKKERNSKTSDIRKRILA